MIKLKMLLLVAVLFLSWQAHSQLLIEAEDYSAMSGIETEGCSDIGGGLNVGWIDNGDWIEYKVDIPADGEYLFSFRVAGEKGGTLTVLSNDLELGSIDIASTGAWQEWESVEMSNSLSLSKGENTIRLLASTGGYNINWWSIKLTSPVDTDLPTAPKVVYAEGTVHDIKLIWEKSNDKTSGVTGYKILRDSVPYAFTQDTLLELTKQAPNQLFNFLVLATDFAGNESEQVSATVRTDALPWDLAWADEFDYEGKPDPKKWYYETGGGGWGNGEAQYYTEGDNADVTNGTLIIEARKENHGNNDFTSTRLNSTQSNDFLYGRVEVKAKLPKTGGTWPAIWTLPTDWVYGGWPDCGEIDIMEHSATYSYGYIFGTIHTGAYNHQDDTQQSGGIWFDDVTDTYHTYILEWYPDHIDWYVDDIHIFTFENEYKTTAEWPYDIPHHLLLNVAIGGGLGGNIDYDGEWPQQMIVDYVRVYDFKLNESDTIAPNAPESLKADMKWTAASLTWSTARDNYGIEKYIIFVDDVAVDTVNGTSALVGGLVAETEYVFGVKAVDYAGNESEMTTIIASTTEVQSIEIPGVIEAENFTFMEGVDTESCTDDGGGKNVGWIHAGDWLSYTINVTEDIDYKAAFRVAGEGASCSILLETVDGTEITTLDFTVGGGWQNWKSVISESFSLPQGVQEIKLKIIKGGFNLNWIKIGDDDFLGVENNLSTLVNIYPNPVKGEVLFVDIPVNSEEVQVMLMSIDGKVLINKQIIVQNNRIELYVAQYESGAYILRLNTSKARIAKKIVIE